MYAVEKGGSDTTIAVRGDDLDLGIGIPNRPNLSINNLIYVNDDDDVDDLSYSERSYLEEDDLPLPVISDSDSSRFTRCGQCCDCCDHCLRNTKWTRHPKCKWMKVLFYYVTLNMCMLIFLTFVMFMTAVPYTKYPLSPAFPQYTYMSDLEPGLTLLPSKETLKNNSVPMIWYGTKNPSYTSGFDDTVLEISHFLRAHQKACGNSTGCNNDITKMKGCAIEYFGYKNKKPCIYLKLNRLETFVPEKYSKESNIPEDVPEELKNEIDLSIPNLWVNCRGHTLHDEEVIGKIDYVSGPFFAKENFPTSDKRDTNPLIAIRLPEVKVGYVGKLVCGIYAKNVHNHQASSVRIFIKD